MNTLKRAFTAFSVAVLTAVLIYACNSASEKKTDRAVQSTEPVNAELSATKAARQALSIDPVITQYLALKNALVADNGKDAAAAGKALLSELNALDSTQVPSGKAADFSEISADAKENAEHIGDNAEKIAHQREHFVSLSEDIDDLIAIVGTKQVLYQDHCPMYNDGKGAIWLSEVKEIKNPYYGTKMTDCGTLKKTY